MAREAVLAIDQGTTNTKALFVLPSGDIAGVASRPTNPSYPAPGWAEVDPDAVWQSVLAAVLAASDDAGEVSLRAIGIANQRESAMIWDAATGQALGPCILWQCRRTAEACEALRGTDDAALIAERSGLGIDPLFSALKIKWLLEHAAKGIPAERLRAGTVDSWLVYKLTGGRHVTDHSNAARTQLYALDEADWSDELLEIFGVPRKVLPEILSSDADFGETAPGLPVPAGVPIRAVMGDSHAALFGHGIERPGEAKVTCGTGSSLMMLTEERTPSLRGLSSTVAWCRADRLSYALEGNITVSGQTIAFVRRLLGIASERELEALAQTVPGSGGVRLVPALAGLGAPYWDTDARGMISGMDHSTMPAHLARAAYEAVALQIRDVFSAMEADSGRRVPFLSVDGGAAASDFLMELLAGLLDRPVHRMERTEVSALGVARMAGEGAGLAMPPAGAGAVTAFEPAMAASVREAVVKEWDEAVQRARFDPGRGARAAR